MKQQYNIDVHDLEQRCWQACEDGNKAGVLRHHKEVKKTWEEQKRVIDGLLKQIEGVEREARTSKPKKQKALPKATTKFKTQATQGDGTIV
jgi:mannose/cellobiose epimerase-like protein (N-acyl-D-glucosamine 2-epimerase family)